MGTLPPNAPANEELKPAKEDQTVHRPYIGFVAGVCSG